jgi:hypothetical protein
MKRAYVKVGKHFGEKPNPRKEAELKEAVRMNWLRNCRAWNFPCKEVKP